MTTKYERKEPGIKVDGETVGRNCWLCHRGGSKKCSGCKVRRYCGATCQTKDWRRHKQECKDFQMYGSESIDMDSVELVDNLEKDPEFRAMFFRAETPEKAEELMKDLRQIREKLPPRDQTIRHTFTLPAKPRSTDKQE